MSAHRYFILNKPYNMVSQFISSHDVRLLSELKFDFPEGTHAIGRLDNHSEGLLLLTTDKRVTRLLFQGEVPHTRTYLVQVKNTVSAESVKRLREGISIRVKGGDAFITTSCNIVIVDPPDNLFSSGYELRKGVACTWLRITLTEGKFHQVRKMVAAVNHRCKRLIRISIEDICLDGLEPGAVREISKHTFFKKLRISPVK